MAYRYKAVYMAYYIDKDLKMITPVCIDYHGRCLMSETRAGLSKLILGAQGRGWHFPPFGKRVAGIPLVAVPTYEVKRVRIDWSEDQEIELRKAIGRRKHAKTVQEAARRGWEKPSLPRQVGR